MTPTSGVRYEGRDLEAMAFAENYHRWILDVFRPFLGRRLVEVGAGAGSFSQLLCEEATGALLALEPSDDMFPLLQRRLEGRKNAVAAKAFFADAARQLVEEPDTVLYVNVLEHVEDDGGEIALAFRHLAPGGHLCLFVPALRALYGSFDRAVGHLRRYHLPSLRGAVVRAGFDVVHARYFDALGALPWWFVFCLLKRSNLGAGQVSLYDRWAIPIVRSIEDRRPPPFGKNIILVARKPLTRETR